jgi:glycosyltransferase involved in cell wall biosynthesis
MSLVETMGNLQGDDEIVNNTSLVSSIIIFFNAEQFFEEAIASVLAQTYQHWELLLADDGSTDGSTAIAQKYAQIYPEKIRYLEHEDHQNRGMSATRNLGIRHAKGEYIAFLDADDVWLPHKLKQQVEIMQSQPEAGMIYGKSLYWHSWTGDPEDLQRDYIPDCYVKAETLYHPPSLLTLCYPLGGAIPPPPTDIMLRSTTVKELGGFEAGFQNIYQLYEDQAFFAKLYLKFSVFVTDHCWDQYRQHAESCDSVVHQAGKYHTVRLFFLNWLENYLSEQMVVDSQVWDALNRALFPYRYPILHQLKSQTKRFIERTKKIKKLIAR